MMDCCASEASLLHFPRAAESENSRGSELHFFHFRATRRGQNRGRSIIVRPRMKMLLRLMALLAIAAPFSFHLHAADTPDTMKDIRIKMNTDKGTIELTLFA